MRKRPIGYDVYTFGATGALVSIWKNVNITGSGQELALVTQGGFVISPFPPRGGKGYGHMLNQAINFPIQSLASDVTASALIDIEAAFLSEAGLTYAEYLSELIEQRKYLTGLGGRGILPVSQIFNEVHDSLVVDLHPSTAKRDQEIVIECMRSARSLRELAPRFNHKILNADWKLDSHWKSK